MLLTSFDSRTTKQRQDDYIWIISYTAVRVGASVDVVIVGSAVVESIVSDDDGEDVGTIVDVNVDVGTIVDGDGDGDGDGDSVGNTGAGKSPLDAFVGNSLINDKDDEEDEDDGDGDDDGGGVSSLGALLG